MTKPPHLMYLSHLLEMSLSNMNLSLTVKSPAVFVLLNLVNFVLNTFQMGGRSNVQNEVLCRLTFPERPGALMKFLDSFSPRWNISLFHYRGEVGIFYFLLL